MKFRHLLLALLVALIWGLNFIFVRIGLDQLSPYTLLATRFILCSLPLMFFIKPPALPFKWVALYGIVMFLFQFLFMFLGIRAGVAPGLASFIMQVQIFLTMLFAAIFWKEIPSFWQILGALISFSGIGVIAMHLEAGLSFTGFLFVLAGAASWALGNVITKSIGKVNILSLVVWGSFVASLPMIVVSLCLDGGPAIVSSIQHLNWQGVFSILFIVCLSTWVGYGCWSWLLNQYPVSSIAPFTLLIPIFGILSSALILGEPLQQWKIGAGCLIISGLCVNLFGARFFSLFTNSDLIARQNSS